MVEGSGHMSLGKWKKESVPLYGACLDLALKRVPYPKRAFAIGIDEPAYFSNHSAVIPLSKNGETIIHVMKYNGSNPHSDARADERQLTRFLDLLQPGWEKEVVTARYLPNMLIASDSRSFRNHGTGVAPGPAVKEIRGLYVAGDWVGSDGRLAETAMASAKQAAVEAHRLLSE